MAAGVSGGVDTQPNGMELPVATHGQVGIDLFDPSDPVNNPAPTQMATTTTPPNVVVPGSVAIGTTSLPQVPLDVSGAIRPGSNATVLTCGSGQAGGEGGMRYNYTSHQLEYCNGATWVGPTSSSGLTMIAPYQILTGTTATVTLTRDPRSGLWVSTPSWVTLPLPGVPAGAKFVMLQYAYELGKPDGVHNSYIRSTANATSPAYYILAGRAAGDGDSFGSAGQAIVPFDTTTNSIMVSIAPYDFADGYYTLWVVGYR